MFDIVDNPSKQSYKYSGIIYRLPRADSIDISGMRESLQNKLPGNESTNNTLISVENIDAELDLLTASIRSSAFQNKTTLKTQQHSTTQSPKSKSTKK